jgi:signal peptidase II
MQPTPGSRRSTRRLRRAALLALVAACVGCDQGTKRLAESHLSPGERISLLGDTVRLELAHNPGAFLGLGSALPERGRALLFTWGVGLIVLGALFVAFRARTPARMAAAGALAAAGGLGNLWDRIATGGWVVDFLNLGIGPLRTGIFNVADVAIMTAVVLLIWPPSEGVGAPHG